MINFAAFPSQKRPYNKKNTKWREDCVNGAESVAIFNNSLIRRHRTNKRINYDLYSNILHQEDIDRMCNPFNLKDSSSPAKMQNYPLANPKIDLLVGEEERRVFDWAVRVINEDAISSKEEGKAEQAKQYLIGLLTQGIEDPEEVKRKLAEIQRKLIYEYQDVRELRATRILKHLWQSNRLDRQFNKGFKDALLVAEEIYDWDIIGNEPVCRRLNPNQVFTARSGSSPYIEDSDIIVQEEYFSPGQIVDMYYDHLTPENIDLIESYFESNSGEPTFSSSSSFDNLTLKLDELESFTLSLKYGDVINSYSPTIDQDGNIRVCKIRWASFRKIKEVTSYNNLGEEVKEIFDENYKIDKSKGESESIIWIKEWWEGTKIGGFESDRAIYLKMQPRPVQLRSMDNLSKCYPGIVGTIYNTNDNMAMSLMDKMKPYQYLYNVIMVNLELLIATNWGNIVKIPVHELPDGWDIEMWLHYAKTMKAVPYDAFKEGKKGASTGKIAGNMNSTEAVIRAEHGNTIQLYVTFLEFISRQMDNISGITPQRQGAISNRETVGGVERSVNQSSMTTEYWFAEHDFLKKRVLETGLETAKYAWKGQKAKKIDFVLDDLTSATFDLDTEDFVEQDYDLMVTNSYKDKAAIEKVRQLAEMGMQNQTVTIGQVLDLYTMESVSAIRRKFQFTEAEKKQYEEQKMKMQQDSQTEMLQQQSMLADKEKEFELLKMDKQFSYDFTLEELKIQALNLSRSNDKDRDGIPDQLEQQKMMIDKELKEKELKLKEKEIDVKREQVRKANKQN
jgi:hypothetical protein